MPPGRAAAGPAPASPPLAPMPDAAARPAKPVVQIIVDALASRVVKPAMAAGKLPNLAAVAKAGGVHWGCTSIFPSITPAATCALTTGEYPDRTHIAGAYWFDPLNHDVAYFGDDLWTILAESPAKFVNDFHIGLNYHRLKADTVFERVHSAGKTAASLNSMWFRGPVRHEVRAAAKTVLESALMGPAVLTLADFLQSAGLNDEKRLEGPGGPTRRMGFHDEATAAFLLDLFNRDALPDYTLAYFPNNDYTSHEDGPHEALREVALVDATLGGLFALFGGIDGFLDRFALLLTGDHSQADCLDDEVEREILLTAVLGDFQITHGGEEPTDGDQILACPNMRAAQLYLLNEAVKNDEEQVRAALLACDKIDQVIWRTPRVDPGSGGHGAEDASTTYHVATADRGTLRFAVAGSGAGEDDWAETVDRFGNRWCYDGSLDALGLTATGGTVRSADYPNALERVATSFFPESGELWATAKPGHEFRLPRTSTHPGGSHGALHELDSTAPLFYAGLPGDVRVPEEVRTVDVVPLALACLHVESPWEPGAGRIAAVDRS